jgi:hypothetical protein
MPCELFNCTPYPQIPKLNSIVCATRQEGVIRFTVPVAPFKELDRMNVSLMTIWDALYHLVSIGIVNQQLFIATTNQSNMTLHSMIMEGEGGNVLCTRVGEGLQELVETFLLKTLNIILRGLGVGRV